MKAALTRRYTVLIVRLHCLSLVSEIVHEGKVYQLNAFRPGWQPLQFKNPIFFAAIFLFVWVLAVAFSKYCLLYCVFVWFVCLIEQ